MGGANSCFPSPINTIYTLRRRRRRNLLTKIKHDQTRSNIPINTNTNTNTNNNNNNNINAINLNHASEDEFLMLPGITRQIAQNIIQYRQLNNGFKRIDELLYITGINHDLYECIRFDITIDSSSQNLVNNKQEYININSATYNQLCTIPGLTPIVINRIIERRERKGLFRFVEDLLKIKGINYIVLASIRSYITVDDRQIPISVSQSSILEPSVNNLYPTLNKNNNNVTSDSLSLASLLLETLPPELQTILLSSTSSQHPQVTICKNKQTYFRFASWNLQQLTNDKVQNPGVKEVVCRTILEHNFSLIGIQEIGNKEALGYIIQELNNPTIPLIKDWSNRHHGKWNYTISDVAGRMFQGSEYLGFIYDESIGIELKKASLLPFKNYFTRSPYIVIFRIYDKYEFVFVNLHLKARRLDENDNERTKDEAASISILAEAMSDTVEQKYIIIFGDFNIVPTASEFDALVQRNYSYVIKQNTNISMKTPQGSTCIDNIWLSAEAKALTTENSGVIRDNLTSMWIPAGWTWGGIARLISAGKHEIDVVFYSSIDDIKPGREFETDRYLISIEENNNDNQPCPRPSFAVNDPTMKNKPKSAAFVPPRLVPKAEPPPPALMPILERHNPNQWGYAGMTTAMKRNVDDNNSSHVSTTSKFSHFIPPTFNKRQTIQSEKSQEQSVLSASSISIQQQPGLLNDALISRLLNNTRPNEIKSSPVKQSPQISWSAWDDKKSDDEDSDPPPICEDKNILQQPPPIKQTYNWHSLVKSTGQHGQINNETENTEPMPKFDFDDSSFDTLFDNSDE
ncbi:unnamed protein product [Rotaria sp. Silwood2]|nr:unnamed protein product [Rotaria sp. Silwood2]CAF3906870.1 unnamed protein product [Rotaria sp. Silwood2]